MSASVLGLQGPVLRAQLSASAPFSRGLVLSLMSLACSAALAQAADATLEPVIVTATRTPTRSDELVSEVVTVERVQIERSTGRTLQEILAREANLQFSSNGGRGKSSSVYLRGTESRHVLLLIDGVRYGSATAGTPIWDAIPVEQIERIEVLKGPASSIYGADALGGVVQVFTRRGGSGFSPYAYATVGSDSFRELGAGLSGGNGKGLSYALGVQTQEEKGFSATNSKASSFSVNPDRDGFKQDSLNASVDWQVASGWTLNAGLVHSEGVNQFDDGPNRDARTAVRSNVARLGVTGQITPGWTTQLRYAQSKDTSNAIEASFLPSDFMTTQDQWTWQNDLKTPLGVVVVGAEHLRQKVEGSTAYTVSERSISSLFAGLNGAAGPHSWQASLRRDNNSQFGDSTTGFAGYGYSITPAWRVHASHGTSFVAPTFNQLYYPGFGTPTLKPEHGRNTDIGLTWTGGAHSAKLLYFRNKVRDLIVSPAPTYLPQNVDRAEITGWTLGYDGRWNGLGFNAALDLLDPVNEATGLQLIRRVKEQATVGVDYSTGAWRLGASALASGKRYENAANTTVTPGYATVDLFVSYTLAKDWSLQAKVNNLADREYETARGYNQPGRSVYLTVRWQPK